MKNNTNKYLTIEEKRELAFKGKRVPICISNSNKNNEFIAKIRTVFYGSLKNKKFKL